MNQPNKNKKLELTIPSLTTVLSLLVALVVILPWICILLRNNYLTRIYQLIDGLLFQDNGTVSEKATYWGK
jgi:hypothetical protein